MSISAVKGVPYRSTAKRVYGNGFYGTFWAANDDLIKTDSEYAFGIAVKSAMDGVCMMYAFHFEEIFHFFSTKFWYPHQRFSRNIFMPKIHVYS